jgi:hypothetical protein
MRKVRIRFWLEAALSVVTGSLALLTAVLPHWIERLSHADPDQGSGRYEWIAVCAVALVTVALSALARMEWQRARRTHGWLLSNRRTRNAPHV